MKLETYPTIIADLKKKGRKYHLLMGNGFSMAYDSTIFSYKSLSQYVKLSENEILKKLFTVIDSSNFEYIMKQLDSFLEISDVLDLGNNVKSKISIARDSLREALILAINQLHPEYVFKIPHERSRNCAKYLYSFINQGGCVFTTNYDLLMYWVLMRNKSDEISCDGFGREAENIGNEYISEEDIEWSELRWGKHKKEQNTFYLHGALPIFDNGVDIIKEEYDGVNFLLENITRRIEKKEYPIFVTAGSSRDKLNHIMHNKYLSFCYEKFTQIEGSLITFGFNFGDYDDHIIDAVNIAAKQGKKNPNRLWSIYIGVYSDEDKKHIESIESKFKCKVHIYDAKTASIWE